MKKTTLALVLSGIVSMNASAAGFFETLDSALKGIENAAGKVAEQGKITQQPSETQVLGSQNESALNEILQKYKDENPKYLGSVATIGSTMGIYAVGCVDETFADEERQFKNALKSGDAGFAIARAQLLAGGYASCALSPDPYINGYTKKDFVHRTADVVSVLAMISSSYEAKEDAEALFKWSGTENGQIAAMNKSFGLNAAVQDAASLSANPYTLVDMKNRNSVAFNRKYEGKVIESVGVVTKISGNERAMKFSLKGSNKDKDHISWSDYVVCNVTNKEEMIKAENYGIGQKVKIKGIYKDGSLGSIELNECGVRPAPKKG